MRYAVAAALSIAVCAPAHAIIVAPWQLEESHFFQWDDWRDVFQFGPCNKIIPYRMANAPPIVDLPWTDVSPPPHFEWTPLPPTYVPPPYTPPPPPVVDTPEVSTWLMMLMGFAGLGGAYWRRARA